MVNKCQSVLLLIPTISAANYLIPIKAGYKADILRDSDEAAASLALIPPFKLRSITKYRLNYFCVIITLLSIGDILS